MDDYIARFAMKITETALEGVVILEPQLIKDARGWFMESWSMAKLQDAGLNYNFVQDNHSYSKECGVLRGIHFQKEPMAQAKLVRCIQGAVLDVAVDLRKNSPTFKKWVSVELSAINKRQLLIPRGFGHGFVTLTPNVEFVYKTDNPYSPSHDCTIHYLDPDLAIDWGVAQPILSEKDKAAPNLCEGLVV